ncbi:zf-HC2 domain-containing protein [Ammonicoccus fulvus]|uniref:Zf-HC2 domain-containing protein n=1 Tax=Ammonicoccus fulvus TaxID=3138240 RepID=A0ABZ3FSU9_9ACTN
MTDDVHNQADHPSVEVLSDAAADLLSASEAQRIQAHLEACADCRDVAAALADACLALESLPAPPMPDAVFARLTAVVQAESQRRASGVARAEEDAEIAEAAKRTDLGTFGQNPTIGKQVPIADAHLVGRRLPPDSDQER